MFEGERHIGQLVTVGSCGSIHAGWHEEVAARTPGGLVDDGVVVEVVEGRGATRTEDKQVARGGLVDQRRGGGRDEVHDAAGNVAAVRAQGLPGLVHGGLELFGGGNRSNHDDVV